MDGAAAGCGGAGPGIRGGGTCQGFQPERTASTAPAAATSPGFASLQTSSSSGRAVCQPFRKPAPMKSM